MLGLISVFIGGSIGSSLRYLISLAAANFGFSYQGTFVINILGCLFLGFVSYFALKKEQTFDPNLKLFMTTGLAGGFTTFSTFSYEAVELIKSGNVQTAVIYMLASLFVGLLATGLGMLLAKNMLGSKEIAVQSEENDIVEETAAVLTAVGSED